MDERVLLHVRVDVAEGALELEAIVAEGVEQEARDPVALRIERRRSSATREAARRRHELVGRGPIAPEPALAVATCGRAHVGAERLDALVAGAVTSLPRGFVADAKIWVAQGRVDFVLRAARGRIREQHELGTQERLVPLVDAHDALRLLEAAPLDARKLAVQIATRLDLEIPRGKRLVDGRRGSIGGNHVLGVALGELAKQAATLISLVDGEIGERQASFLEDLRGSRRVRAAVRQFDGGAQGAQDMCLERRFRTIDGRIALLDALEKLLTLRLGFERGEVALHFEDRLGRLEDLGGKVELPVEAGAIPADVQQHVRGDAVALGGIAAVQGIAHVAAQVVLLEAQPLFKVLVILLHRVAIGGRKACALAAPAEQIGPGAHLFTGGVGA